MEFEINVLALLNTKLYQHHNRSDACQCWAWYELEFS